MKKVTAMLFSMAVGLNAVSMAAKSESVRGAGKLMYC
ncbi:malate:quinone oxidoreductase [Escherichia coli]|uniref:Malate:quinone oxidoreductase n=1 Tax=Escherichia coli TaxID=562 RepID=A0A376SAV3_ECOLX|nr:malate:quinone oxidoreductase [Escherichia coli]